MTITFMFVPSPRRRLHMYLRAGKLGVAMGFQSAGKLILAAVVADRQFHPIGRRSLHDGGRKASAFVVPSGGGVKTVDSCVLGPGRRPASSTAGSAPAASPSASITLLFTSTSMTSRGVPGGAFLLFSRRVLRCVNNCDPPSANFSLSVCCIIFCSRDRGVCDIGAKAEHGALESYGPAALRSCSRRCHSRRLP